MYEHIFPYAVLNSFLLENTINMFFMLYMWEYICEFLSIAGFGCRFRRQCGCGMSMAFRHTCVVRFSVCLSKANLVTRSRFDGCVNGTEGGFFNPYIPLEPHRIENFFKLVVSLFACTYMQLPRWVRTCLLYADVVRVCMSRLCLMLFVRCVLKMSEKREKSFLDVNVVVVGYAETNSGVTWLFYGFNDVSRLKGDDAGIE